MKKPSSVDQVIQESLYPEILKTLRTIILEMGLDETIKWMFPVYTLKNKNVVGLGSFKKYAGIWFFQGALLKDEAKKLVNAQEGKTQAMRQWRFHSKEEMDIDLIKAYIYEAIENEKAGRQVKLIRTKKTALPIPDILQSRLEKQDKTKVKRLNKIIPLIIAGKGLNDKYR